MERFAIAQFTGPADQANLPACRLERAGESHIIRRGEIAGIDEKDAIRIR
jgi:hypothetical protein